MQRTTLVRLVVSLFLVLFAAFLLVLFTSLNANTENNRSTNAFEFADLAIGQTGKRRYQGKAVWVTHLSKQQQTSLVIPNPHVVSTGGCKIKQYCVLTAATMRDGIDISFTLERPPQVPSAIPWNGGFVNPLNGAVYDLLGRAYLLNPVTHQQALPDIALPEGND